MNDEGVWIGCELNGFKYEPFNPSDWQLLANKVYQEEAKRGNIGDILITKSLE